MKRYTVVFSENAAVDLASSIQWGYDNWGESAALQWYEEFRNSIVELLGAFPFSQPQATDNGEFDVEVRQKILGRYRVLFTVQKKLVVILHIRGPYVE